MRDMVQNHLLQLLTLTAMEPPIDFDARRRPQREGQGAARDAAARATRPRSDRARPVRRRAGSTASEVPGYREEQGVDPDSTTETYVALQLCDRQLALGRRAVLPAHRQAAAEARDRDRDPVQAARRTCCSRTSPARTLRAERAAHAHPARRGHLAARSARKCPAPACTSAAGEHGLSLRRRVRVEACRRRTSACCWTRCWATRRCSPARRGRGAVEARRRDRGRLAARSATIPQLRGRLLGPGGRRRAAASRRALMAQALTARGLSPQGTVHRGSAGDCPAGDCPHRRDGRGSQTSSGELARQRVRSRDDDVPELRNSTMTHVAWAPPRWLPAARKVLAGLHERHPARTIILVPSPWPSRCRRGGTGATVREFSLRGLHREVISEVVEVRLRGRPAQHPASIVAAAPAVRPAGVLPLAR